MGCWCFSDGSTQTLETTAVSQGQAIVMLQSYSELYMSFSWQVFSYSCEWQLTIVVSSFLGGLSFELLRLAVEVL